MKRQPADLTARNLKPLLRRLFKLEQEIVLLKGDRNKLRAQVKELQRDVRDLDAMGSEITH